MPPRVSICTVTYNAAGDLREYFAALFALTHRPLDVVIADCASSDDSVAIAREFGGGPLPVRVLAPRPATGICELCRKYAAFCGSNPMAASLGGC